MTGTRASIGGTAGPLRALLGFARLDGRAPAVVLARLLARVALVIVALQLATRSTTNAIAAATASALLFAIRGALAAGLRRAVETNLFLAAADAVLEGDVLRAGPFAEGDVDVALLAGIHHGTRLAADHVLNMIADALAVAAFLTILAATQPPRVMGAALAALAAAGIAALAARRLAARSIARERAAARPVAQHVVAAIGGRLDLVASGRHAEVRAELARHLATWRRDAIAADRASALVGRSPTLLGGAAVVATFVVLGRAHGDVDWAGALRQALVFVSMAPAFAGLAASTSEYMRTVAHVGPLVALLGVPRAPRGGDASPRVPAAVEFRDVRFAYADEAGRPGPEVLAGVSFRWDPDRVLVLTGPNGAGKSTCARLLLGLAKPTGGAIRVGDTDLFELDLDAWRRSIGFLPQRPFFPRGVTVREALAFAARPVSDAEARGALERAALWDALSRGGRAPLDVDAGSLSVGQRQRLALARALAADAPVLVLDEPDANLDAAGITLVAQIVRALRGQRMVAVVAHSPELVACGDLVVTLAPPSTTGGTADDVNTS